LSAIHIIDISSKVTSLLVKASLVTAEPVWSPDGNWIAFTKNEPDEPIVVTPNDIPMFRQGNIWIGSVDGKNVQQITFVVGRASQPSWSIDSQTLSFISHDGQIGMVNINQPGKIWQIAGPMQSWTNFISASFMP
jgi:Tol biopolymer transport system component